MFNLYLHLHREHSTSFLWSIFSTRYLPFSCPIISTSYLPFSDQLRFVSHLYNGDSKTPSEVQDIAKVSALLVIELC